MTLHLTVPNMACSACVETITKAVRTIDDDAKITADPKTKQVEIETIQAESLVRDAIATRKLLKQVWVAGGISLVQ